MLHSWNCWLSGNSVFNFLRNCQTVFQSPCFCAHNPFIHLFMKYVYLSLGCFLLGFVPPRLSPSFPAQTQESPELQHVGMQGQGKSSGWQEALTRAPVRRPRPGSAGMLTVGRLAGPAAAFLMRPERPGHICIFAGGKQLAFQKLFILCIT